MRTLVQSSYRFGRRRDLWAALKRLADQRLCVNRQKAIRRRHTTTGTDLAQVAGRLQVGRFPTLQTHDVTHVTIESSKVVEADPDLKTPLRTSSSSRERSAVLGPYPFASMLQGSASFIAVHVGQIAVFHIPESLVDPVSEDELFADISLAWLLGMKIVIVATCWFPSTSLSLSECSVYEYNNTLRPVDAEAFDQARNNAGVLRIEIERRLNRHLRVQKGSGDGEGDGSTQNGHVVSGSFYTAHRIGHVPGDDFQCAGFVAEVNTEQIHRVLERDDIVLLTPVGFDSLGENVIVNGYHLAATVASSLGAYKLIYMATEGSVLFKAAEKLLIQEVPLSFAQALVSHHNLEILTSGFVRIFDLGSMRKMDPCSVELLFHLAWASWAMEGGVRRAHIVNPEDGALLEELFTNGRNVTNTCLFQDEEAVDMPETFVDGEFGSFP